jgi:hypothetical protein
MASRFGPAQPRGVGWKGAGGWLILSQARQVNFSRTVWIPAQHRTKLHGTNPIERLNEEVKRRTDVVGIFPNEASITRLIGTVLFGQNDQWQTRHCYIQVEALGQTDGSATDPLVSITTQAA